jgi:RimJ/RimL family protein N-acetyltransferase
MPFDLQPELTGSLVRLRPLRAEDFDDLYRVAADPLIWEQHPASDRYKEDVFREFFRVAMASGGAFLVTDAADGRAIGSTRFHGYDEADSSIEVGWTFLARSHWGGAHNGEMKRLMLEHAFRFVEKVVFVIGVHNTRSRRAVEKIGATLVGTRQEPGGERVVYRITPHQLSSASAHPRATR